MKMLHVNLHFFKLKYNCFTVLVSVTFLHGNNFQKSFISSVSLDSGNEDPRVPSKRKKSLYTDGFSKPGKNKTASTTPNFKKLHEARFKEMESIDQYVERKKKHFEEHNSFNELKVC